MTLRVCLEPGCGVLIERGLVRCPTHTRAADRARGSKAERGYTADHVRESKAWRQRIDAGEHVLCWRCGEPIAPGEPMDLGHTDDRTAWAGPEHANRCNRAAAGRKKRSP